MKLVMEGQPLLVHLAVWACVAVFLVSFLGVLCGIYLALTRTEALVTKVDERALPYWERAARKNSRVSSILVQSEFKYLRRLMFSAIAGSLASFGSLLLIIRVFGTRT
ncbi:MULTISPECIES: hypothetical protein [unclassified Mesorhizobium]|uniref:hypothetical protein n=1 Tax=unclassified Mesorhizobium TaxID=325217 RepID=UPI001CCFA159|nr:MULTISPECIES: hypothetical protein [unclassified Mesorhizobium]MBZ9741781.1 hypothetical protein [Mesorhizobium sp. CO1-1-4]MBZ9803874.1 hypothetical protein [Mesorhizobium sp. ES1-6]MBZ9994651.1 hypothetical protein [Mesorhizobium sp. BH1-1-4]